MGKKLTIKQKILIGLGIIILVLMLTNPDMKAFKECRGYDSYAGIKREQNWIIFSFYSDDNYWYLGIFKNFFK